MFVELTKIVPQTMEKAYKEERNFVNFERDLRLDKNNKVTIEAEPKKDKRRVSLDRSHQDKMINKSKHFMPNDMVSGQ